MNKESISSIFRVSYGSYAYVYLFWNTLRIHLFGTPCMCTVVLVGEGDTIPDILTTTGREIISVEFIIIGKANSAEIITYGSGNSFILIKVIFVEVP